MTGPKVALLKADGHALVAGLPPSLRSAARCATELKASELVFSCEKPSGFANRWRLQLAGLNVPYRVVSGKPDLGPGSLEFPGDGFLTSKGWVSITDDAQARAAERELFRALPKDTDGYIARLDRKLSIALSRLLLELPITPNQITTASLVLGIAASYALATGGYGQQLAASLVLWFCCILDGCDGEVARLKLLCSPRGAAYDVAADHFAHLATFVAIPFAIHRTDPSASFVLPGVLLVAGFLTCMASVWWLVLRKPEREQGPYSLLIERVASRDYVYLIVLLAALGKLSWFLWAAGIGSHVFCAALWLVAWKATPLPSPAAPPALPRA
jgi:phosphatidylglycerophosphate synthase